VEGGDNGDLDDDIEFRIDDECDFQIDSDFGKKKPNNQACDADESKSLGDGPAKSLEAEIINE
jgi:hypothetical protein